MGFWNKLTKFFDFHVRVQILAGLVVAAAVLIAMWLLLHPKSHSYPLPLPIPTLQPPPIPGVRYHCPTDQPGLYLSYSLRGKGAWAWATRMQKMVSSTHPWWIYHGDGCRLDTWKYLLPGEVCAGWWESHDYQPPSPVGMEYVP